MNQISFTILSIATTCSLVSGNENHVGTKNLRASRLFESVSRMLDHCTPSPVPAPSPSPTLTPIATYSDKMFVPSDGESGDNFGGTCSMYEDLVAISAQGNEYFGSVYLFDLDGNELTKLRPTVVEEDTFQGLSLHEKIAIGFYDKNIVQVFFHDGELEKTITCEDCEEFGFAVATHKNKVVISGKQDLSHKLFVYSTSGELLKTHNVGVEMSLFNIVDLAISDDFIVWTSFSKTCVYSNSGDYSKISEIEVAGSTNALSGERLVIGYFGENNMSGAAYLYDIYGTLIKELEHDDLFFSGFGSKVAMTDSKILVSQAQYYDESDGMIAGSVSIYSSSGDFEEMILSPNPQQFGYYGSCLSAYGSHYVVGASGEDEIGEGGVAYLFSF